MDSDQQETSSLRRGKNLNPKELTIMVIRSVGKIRSFTISRKVIVWTSGFLLAYILISVYIFNSFFDLRYRYNIQSEKLKNTEEDLNQSRKNLILTEQYVAGLEDYIQNSAERSEQVAKPATGDSPNADIINRIGKDVNESNTTGNISLRDVDIKDITIQRVDSGLNLDFKLVNNRSEENAIEGYIHIIAADKNSDYPPVWNSRNNIQNGVPENYRRGGLPFFIQRFKPYHRQFNMNSDSEFPTLIKILVYDQSGKLMLEKEFKVSDVS
jgi:hypothetical protein